MRADLENMTGNADLGLDDLFARCVTYGLQTVTKDNQFVLKVKIMTPS
jgi:hypothetical protein